MTTGRGDVFPRRLSQARLSDASEAKGAEYPHGTCVHVLAFRRRRLRRLVSLSLLVESLLLLPVVYLGVTVGTRFFGALSDARFYRIFQVILLLMAMGLVWKGSVAVL